MAKTITDSDLLDRVGTTGTGQYRGLRLTFGTDHIEYSTDIGGQIATGEIHHGDTIGAHLLAVTDIRNLAASLAGDEPQVPAGVAPVDQKVVEGVAKNQMDLHAAQWESMHAAGLDVGDEKPHGWAEASPVERDIALAAAAAALSEAPTGDPVPLPAP